MKLLSIVEDCVREQFVQPNLKTAEKSDLDYFNTTQKATNISQNGVDFIKKYEKFIPTKYNKDGHDTIGYGTRIDYHPELINKRLSEIQASKILDKDLADKVTPYINRYVKIPLTQNQFDALSSLIYNVGVSKFLESNLLKMLNSKNVYGIKKDWAEFRLSDGKVLAGLVNRRNEELKTFFS